MQESDLNSFQAPLTDTEQLQPALVSHRAISTCALADSARLRAAPRSGPRRRLPLDSACGPSIGGNRPKFTFIGWNEGGPGAVVSILPPGVWVMGAPRAVVPGASRAAALLRWPAGSRPAIRPTAALST